MSLAPCFAAIAFSIAAVLLRNLGWRGAPVFAVLCFVVLLSELPSRLLPVAKLFSSGALVGESAAAILKIIGCGYLFGISAELCRELGESAIASALTLVGRFEVIALVLPFIGEALDIALSLIA